MQYDIIIVGGGMVGGSLACALAQQNLKIALLDAAPLNTVDDPRLIALNHSSVCLFKNLHVWAALAEHAEPITQVHISDRGQFGMTRLHANTAGLTSLGHVVPAKNINAALDQLLQQGQCDILRPSVLQSLSQTATAVTLTTADGKQLQAKLVIAADGTQSTVRKELGIPVEVIASQQSALVTVTTLQRSHHNIAYERFHPTGALAMLPLPGLQAATIWTDSDKVINALLQLDEAAFLAMLQKQFGYRIGKFLQTGTRHVYPLQQLSATKTFQQRVLLVGNAAHTFHPIAAQGLNLALAEIAMLTQYLSDHPQRTDWSDYAVWQAQRQTTSRRLSDQLPGLFTQTFWPVRLARQLGLLTVDIWPPLKSRFTRAAMGKIHTLPRLLLDHDEQ